MSRKIIIFGANGGIGRALVTAYQADLSGGDSLHAISRSPVDPYIEGLPNVIGHQVDMLSDTELSNLTQKITTPNHVIIATGLLSDGDRIKPEKTLRQQDLGALGEIFTANTFVPALIAKHILPAMPRKGPVKFAALSARVGSISDNKMGGWHAYRASKAALNMLMKCYAIEMARLNPQSCCVGLHPGTVQTNLSAPFQTNIHAAQLFNAEFAAQKLKTVLAHLSSDDSGKLFDWAGKEIPA